MEFSAGADACARLRAAAHEAGAGVVFSAHDFRTTPDTGAMTALLTAMADAGADVAKLAVTPADPADAARLLQATAQAAALRPETPLLTMAMGPLGAVTRVCGAAFGVCASFGTAGAASAPRPARRRRPARRPVGPGRLPGRAVSPPATTVLDFFRQSQSPRKRGLLLWAARRLKPCAARRPKLHIDITTPLYYYI